MSAAQDKSVVSFAIPAYAPLHDSKRRRISHVLLPLIFSVGIGMAGSVSATPQINAPEPPPAAATDSAAQARAVRLSSVEGQVQVLLDGQTITDQAYANLPLFQGSQIITGNDGRAELQLEDGSIARLTPNSKLTLSVLAQEGSGTRTEMAVDSGLVYFELQQETPEHSLQVSYGPTFFSPNSFAVVRVTEDAPPGELAVLSGTVNVDRGNAGELEVHGAQSLTIDPSDPGNYNLAQSVQPDSWDNWNTDRDQFLASQSSSQTAASGNYAGSGAEGMADLDANGNWYNVPGQGYVWSPYDAQGAGTGWDPYGYGNWVYYPQFGYIWNSSYSWGYAPFQCGLWNYYDNFGWGWAPGSSCTGWWGGGGWLMNIGGYPVGYRPPHRPYLPPTRPRGGPVPVRPGLRGSHVLASAPVIPVDRRGALPARSSYLGRPGAPMIISGQTIQPLRPIAPRQSYGSMSNSLPGRPSNVAPGVVPGYGRPPVGQPGQSVQPGYLNTPRPAAPTPRPAAPPAYHPPSSSSPRASSPPSGGHSSGGGIGGGGTHR